MSDMQTSQYESKSSYHGGRDVQGNMKRAARIFVYPLLLLLPIIILLYSDQAEAGLYTTSEIVSDDFSICPLDTGVWTFVNPAGDGTLSMNGEAVVLSVPAGTVHDTWGTSANDFNSMVPRIMQPVVDGDFEIEVKFDAVLSQGYQMQGVLVEQDNNDMLRLEFLHDGSNLKVYAASFTEGAAATKYYSTIPSSNPIYMRVQRVGDQWTQSYSSDGVNWTSMSSFTHTMNVTGVGAYVGNSNAAHSVAVDYFFDTATPIMPEDGSPSQHSLTVGTTGNGTVSKIPNQASYACGETVTLTATADTDWVFNGWSGDLSGNDNPATLTITNDATVSASFISQPTQTYVVSIDKTGSGTILITPDQPSYSYDDEVTVTATPDTGWNFNGWSGDLSGSPNPAIVTITDDVLATANFSQSMPVIDVWYGLNQSFGHLGNAQRWVNILGNVSDPDGVASLTYSLNGEPALPLSIGPDTRRLARDGDFNVEIDRQDLAEGLNQVVITAADNLSNIGEITVTVNYNSTNVWPLPFEVDWNSTTNIQDAVQVVDGLWNIVPDGVRTGEVDYDRVLAIGDLGWTEYEVTVPITVHAIDPDGYLYPSVSPGFGLTMRWSGHTDDPVICSQPHCGWQPSGAGAWYDIGQNGPLSLGGSIDPSITINVGDSYIWKMRVKMDSTDTIYSLKVWQNGQPEPLDWNGTISRGPNEEQSGSLLFIAHHVDATFGDVLISPVGSNTGTLTVNTVGNGVVNIDPDLGTYNSGDLVTLTAVADPGWVFSGWSGDLTGSANPNVLTIAGDQVVTATFSLPDTTAPTVPADLAAANISSARVDLTWTASSDPESGISHYLIYRDGSSIGQSSTNSYTDTTVAPESTYSYEVSAVNNQLLESGKSTALSATTPAASNNLIAHWTLNEITGGNASDSSGNNHDGTLVNGPVWTAGYDNNGLDFDGSDDYVEVDAAPFDFASWSAMTVAAWVKNDVGVGAGTDDIISYWKYPASRGWILTHHNNDQYFWEIDGKGAISGGTVSTNWTYVVATYDGATGFMRLYVDGVEVANLGGLSGNLPSSTANLRIAAQQNRGNYFDGTIDEVRIYNQALSAQEVLALYNTYP